MGLRYTPIKTQSNDRSWRTTLSIDTLIKVLNEKFPNFENEFKKAFTEEEKIIQLHENKIQLTHYQEGEAVLIYEEKNNIQPQTNPSEPI